MKTDTEKQEECQSLLRLIEEEKEHIKKFTRFLMSGGDEINVAFSKLQIQNSEQAIDRAEKKIERLFPRELPEGWITDEMIETAREYPITKLLDFHKGRCEAFCHESDSFSMSYNRKVNKAHCFVCNKSFNPVDVLMERDGMSFIDAVKQLN